MNGPQRMFALAAILAAAGMWLMLPRGTQRGRFVGGLLAAIGLVLWAAPLPSTGNGLDDAVFFVLAGVTIVAAALAISLVSPVYCALWFGLSLLGTASLFLYQGAQFLALATVVIYAGAILVTFLFVLMLAQPEGQTYYDRVSWESLLSAATGAVMIGVLLMTLYNALAGPAGSRVTAAAAPAPEQLQHNVLAPEHVERLGTELFSRHLVAVEVIGVLLLAALVGATAVVSIGRTPPRPARAEAETKA